MLATASLGAIVFALSQAADIGWTSTQTVILLAAGLAGWSPSSSSSCAAAQPLLRIERLADRGVGGGLAMMLAAAAALFGTFLLISLYMQNVLGTGPLLTGLGFLPLAVALAAGVHVGQHVLQHAGLRLPMAAGFATAAGGMLLLSGADAGGSYLGDVLPGHARDRPRPGRRARLRVRVGHDRRRRRRERHALRPEHHRPRDRRHDRHRRPRDHRRRWHGDTELAARPGSATPSW